MENYKNVYIVIERLEYYITKEIEKSIYGDGDKSYTALHNRLIECINARRELNYKPIPENIREFLSGYGYDDDFINEFLEKAEQHSVDECPGN